MKVKSIDEILEKFGEVVRRHRRRYLQRNLRTCPLNCKFAELAGNKVVGCEGCDSHNPDRCYEESKFVPIMNKEELIKEFRDELRNPQILLRDYRDIVFFMWVLGVPIDKEVDEKVISKVENAKEPEKPHRVIYASENVEENFNK